MYVITDVEKDINASSGLPLFEVYYQATGVRPRQPCFSQRLHFIYSDAPSPISRGQAVKFGLHLGQLLSHVKLVEEGPS